jgi:predicted nuclease of predicted toxin-antitoxin system
METTNNGAARIQIIDLLAADGNAAATTREKGLQSFDVDVNSAYDEEEVIVTRESDYRKRQVCLYSLTTFTAKR